MQGCEHDMTLCRIYMFVSLPSSPAEENTFFLCVEDGERVTVKAAPLKNNRKGALFGAPCLERRFQIRAQPALCNELMKFVWLQ